MHASARAELAFLKSIEYFQRYEVRGNRLGVQCVLRFLILIVDVWTCCDKEILSPLDGEGKVYH